MKKRVLAVALCLALVLAVLPMGALAQTDISSIEDLVTALGTGNATVSGNRVILTNNVTLSDSLALWDCNVVLDLGGKTLTSSGTIFVAGGQLTIEDSTAQAAPTISSDGNYTVTYQAGKIYNPHNNATANGDRDAAIRVENGGTLILNSGIIESQTGYTVAVIGQRDPGNWATAPINSTFIVNGGYQDAQEGGPAAFGNGAVITVNGGVIEGRDNACLAGNGTVSGTSNDGGYTINMKGGTLIGRIISTGYASCGIYHPNAGTVNMSGGTIISTNGAGIVSRAGQTNITGGTILALGNSSTTGKVGDSSVVVTTSGVVLDLAANYPGAQTSAGESANADVTVSGSPSISGTHSALEVVENTTITEQDNVNLRGGVYSSPVDADYLASGAASASLNSAAYYVGDGIAALQSSAKPGDTVTVHQGSVSLNLPAGVKVSNSSGGSVTVNGDPVPTGQAVTSRIQNTDPITADLVVTRQYDGSSQPVQIRVTLGRILTGSYGGHYFDHGVGVFTLQPGQSLYFHDLPANMAYDVAVLDGLVTAESNMSGTTLPNLTNSMYTNVTFAALPGVTPPDVVPGEEEIIEGEEELVTPGEEEGDVQEGTEETVPEEGETPEEGLEELPEEGEVPTEEEPVDVPKTGDSLPSIGLALVLGLAACAVVLKKARAR